LKRKRLGRIKLYGLLDTRLYRLPNCEEASRADKCLDYEAFMEVALKFYNKVVELRQQSTIRTFKVWSSYLALTLIILVNGLRVREALRVAKKFYETNERRLSIQAEKGGDIRNVIIPEFIEREDLEYLYRKMIKTGEENTKRKVSDFLRNVFKVTPHSLRYAFIRYHVLTGKTQEEIARALGLKCRRVIKEYYLRGISLEGEGEGEGYG
jgi:CRISPR/Cas system CMR-associated protein Cmr5 small subunit